MLYVCCKGVSRMGLQEWYKVVSNIIRVFQDLREEGYTPQITPGPILLNLQWKPKRFDFQTSLIITFITFSAIIFQKMTRDTGKLLVGEEKTAVTIV